jgi:hypothetical protein
MVSSIFMVGSFGYNSYLSYQQKILSLTSKLAQMKYKQRVLNKKVKKFRVGFVKKSVFRMKKKVASIPAKSIPFIGTATILALTTYEIKSICMDIDDLYSLEESITSSKDRNDSSMLKKFCRW